MLLDADVLIDIKRGHPPAVAWFNSLSALPPVCGLAAMELLHASRDTAEFRSVRNFLSLFPILWPVPVDMIHAYDNLLSLKLAHGIGLIDTLVAATALGHNLPLATFNVKHFRVVPGLQVVQPYVR